MSETDFHAIARWAQRLGALGTEEEITTFLAALATRSPSPAAAKWTDEDTEWMIRRAQAYRDVVRQSPWPEAHPRSPEQAVGEIQILRDALRIALRYIDNETSGAPPGIRRKLHRLIETPNTASGAAPVAPEQAVLEEMATADRKRAHDYEEAANKAEAEVEGLREALTSDNDLHYLKSILGHLREIRGLPEPLSLSGEILADNIDWLDCFIDKHERKRAALAASPKPKPKVPFYYDGEHDQGMGVPARCHCGGELHLKPLGWTCEKCGAGYGREDEPGAGRESN